MPGVGQRSVIIAALALACAATFFRLGAHPLIDSDEPRYAESAREMIQRGDLLVPYLNGEPRLNKPPVFYWLEVAAMKCLGVSEFAARLPSALAGVATACLAMAFAAGLYGRRAGYFALPVYLSMPLVAGVSRIAMTDMTMTAFLSAAFVLWWKAREKSVSRRLMVLSWGALALAVMTKGPVALALFVLTVGAFCALRREWKMLGASFSPAALAVFLCLTLPWPVAVAFARPEAASLWYRETFERFASGVDHRGSFLLPLGMILGGAFPWCLLAGPMEGGGLKKRFQGLVEKDDTLFLVAWVSVVAVFFTLCRTRMPHYVLPAMFPVAVMAARKLDGVFSGTRDAVSAIARVSIGAGGLAIAAVVYAALRARLLWWHAAVACSALTAGLLFLWFLARYGRRSGALVVLICAVFAGTALLTPKIMEEVSRTRSMQPLVEHWRGELRDAEAIYFKTSLSSRMSLVYYAGRGVGRVTTQADYEAVLASASRTAVIELGDTYLLPQNAGAPGEMIIGPKQSFSIGNRTYFLTLNYVRAGLGAEARR